MSRVIKFRGWHEDAKDMIFFGLGENHLSCTGLEDGERYIFDLEDGRPVMQFTGLHDKNGVEIYEGDILSLERPEGVCVYQMDDPNIDMRFVAYGEDGTPRLMLMDGRPQGSGLTWCKNNAERCFFVIGNIHQTPELLEDV